MDSALLDTLECDLRPEPLFFVEAPAAKPLDPRTWPEEFRQREFVAYVRRKYPQIVLSSFANEGKRGPRMAAKMKGLGLLAGMPDTVLCWPDGVAFLEWKGWTAAGRAGQLSAQQVDTCNRLHRNGFAVGCFFSARTALEWLRGKGAPIA